METKHCDKCSCGCDEVELMHCADCKQPAKGCMQCLRRLSVCHCDPDQLVEDFRNDLVAFPKQFQTFQESDGTAGTQQQQCRAHKANSVLDRVENVIESKFAKKGVKQNETLKEQLECIQKMNIPSSSKFDEFSKELKQEIMEVKDEDIPKRVGERSKEVTHQSDECIVPEVDEVTTNQIEIEPQRLQDVQEEDLNSQKFFQLPHHVVEHMLQDCRRSSESNVEHDTFQANIPSQQSRKLGKEKDKIRSLKEQLETSLNISGELALRISRSERHGVNCEPPEVHSDEISLICNQNEEIYLIKSLQQQLDASQAIAATVGCLIESQLKRPSHC